MGRNNENFSKYTPFCLTQWDRTIIGNLPWLFGFYRMGEIETGASSGYFSRNLHPHKIQEVVNEIMNFLVSDQMSH